MAEIKQALVELRKEKERKFNQTVDLIVNLKSVDLRKTNISLVIGMPHKFKEKKVCGFLESKNDLVKTITKPEFAKYKEKNELKHLIKDYDFFIANAKLMPAVATAFGKALGPSGKMPSPQLGIVGAETDEAIKAVLTKIGKSLKIRAKESSIKIPVGKTDMSDEDIGENIRTVYKAIENALPTKRENVKNVLLKFTMTKTIGVTIK